jgi:uridine kinase
MDAPRREVGIEVSWERAVEAIVSGLGGAGCTPRPIVGITGPVGSGKSTLAGRIAAWAGGCVLSTDRYLPDYDKVAYAERDEPAAADLARLVADLAALAAGRRTRVPIWSFQTHRREGEEWVEPPTTGGVVVCEGLHALHMPVAGSLSRRVYVEASAAVRWARWEVLETTGVRGWGPVVAREFFDRVAEPTFAKWAEGLRRSADVIVVNDRGVGGIPIGVVG